MEAGTAGIDRGLEKIDAVIAKNDPWCRGIVPLGLEAPAEELIRSFEATLAAPSVKGFAVGRTIFSDAARAWLSGGMNDEEAIADMAGRFRQLTQAWLKTRGLDSRRIAPKSGYRFSGKAMRKQWTKMHLGGAPWARRSD